MIAIEIKVRDQKKIIEIWLTGAELNDSAARARVDKLCTRYKGLKYHTVVFESGGGDLTENTGALLTQNLGTV